MIDTIQALCRLPGPSGWEDAVRDYLRVEAAPLANRIETDALGNLLIFKKGRTAPKTPILLTAHMDEVGVIVRELCEDGTLRFDALGEVDLRVLIGKRVWLGPARVPGVIGMKPIHLTTAEERKTLPKLKELYIDIGTDNREAAAALVQLGDCGVFDDRVLPLQNQALRVKALDGRVGCGILLSLLREELPVDCWFAFTVQEEVGARGAFGAAFRLQPGIAVVLDAAPAADLPGVSPARRICQLGKGPVLPFQDRGTLYDRALFRRLTALADENDIPWQTRTQSFGSSDAKSIQRSRAGCRVAAISAPIRYLHSPSCVGCTTDFDQMAALLRLLLADLEVSQ